MLESSPTSLFQECQQIDLKNPNPEVRYCKSFVLSILHPHLFFCWMTCMTSQPLLQLWYFVTCKHSPGDFWICASWEAPLLPLGRTERRGKQFSFFSAPFCVTMAARAHFSITCSKPHQEPTGQVGEILGSAALLPPFCSAVLPSVCWSVEGNQPKLSAWAGNSKDGESRQEISC